jgi:hypothetical protein
MSMISLFAKTSLTRWVRFQSASKALGAVTDIQRDIGRKVAFRQMEEEKKYNQDENFRSDSPHSRKLHIKDEVKKAWEHEKKGTNDMNDGTIASNRNTTSNTKFRDIKDMKTTSSSSSSPRRESSGFPGKPAVRDTKRRMSTSKKQDAKDSEKTVAASTAQDKSSTISHSKKDAKTSSAHQSGVASDPKKTATEGAQKTRDTPKSAANTSRDAATRAAHEAGVKTKWEQGSQGSYKYNKK